MSAAQSRPSAPGGAGATRDRILDAAAAIIRRDGLVRATTKQIARQAGCSEALLYKHFPDKRDIFLQVLIQRSPRLDVAGELPGTATVPENLTRLVVALLGFYEQGFPMAASIFGSSDLLAAHRAAMNERGAGPHRPAEMVTAYLEAERDLGRLDQAADCDALARLLTGAALYEAFLASYAGEQISDPQALAARLVAAVNFEP